MECWQLPRFLQTQPCLPLQKPSRCSRFTTTCALTLESRFNPPYIVRVYTFYLHLCSLVHLLGQSVVSLAFLSP
jgi:hypothetical protein